MNADSAFQIGASHAVCQDYSLAGGLPLAGGGLPLAPAAKSGSQVAPYVILSDGCSSSPDTDTGARLLVKAAEQTLLGCDGAAARDPSQVHKEAARRALLWVRRVGLRPQAVDATLLTAHLDGDELILGCTGDGVICLQSAAGTIDVYSISYASGYPLYPVYTHQPERLLTWEDVERSGKEVKHFRAASIEVPLRLKNVARADRPTEVFAVRASDYKYVALFSDGIHSFYSAARTETSRRVEPIAMEEVLRDLVSFKNVRGAFVERRLNRFLKDCRAKGWQHADDLAFGALYLGD
jgi:hypothetical protein